MSHIHHAGCSCLAGPSRRGLFALGFGAAVTLATRPTRAMDYGYEAMLVKCIDPRFTTNTWAYMAGRGWQNLYSQFNIAGGPVGCVAPAFAAWHQTWWDNFKISYDLHEIKRVVAVCHRDCGAAVVAYGERIKKDRAFETERLSEALRTFRDEVKKRHSDLPVELGIMELNGAVEVVG
jgi:hypothetical protein